MPLTLQELGEMRACLESLGVPQSILDRMNICFGEMNRPRMPKARVQVLDADSTGEGVIDNMRDFTGPTEPPPDPGPTPPPGPWPTPPPGPGPTPPPDPGNQ